MYQALTSARVLACAALIAVSACTKPIGPGAVDETRLRTAAAEPSNWMTYGGTYDEQRYSTLKQIDATNVSGLKLAWFYDLDTNRGQEATPLVIDGVMYTTSAWSKVFALDAKTGALLWKYDPEVPGGTGVHACCDVVNRGVAVWKGKVFVGALDGRLIALDAKTGAVAWSVDTVADHAMPYTITGAPRVFKDKVVIGNGGAELGVRGYVTAYDTETGKLVWRFYTVPGDPSKPADGAASDDVLASKAANTWFGNWYKYGGGGTVWDAIVYDQELDQLYLGVGNGSPWNQKIRSDGKGDNLFLSSIVALDPDTGKYLWHYQANPGETWDFTNTQPIVLATLTIDGAAHKVLMQAPKNGFFYVIDRTNGKLLSAKNYAPVNWATGIDMQTGRPIETPNARYASEIFAASPNAGGAHVWHPMSFNPQTGLVYIPVNDTLMNYGNPKDFVFHQGRWNIAVDLTPPPDVTPPKPTGHLLAWDPIAQKEVWRAEYDRPFNGGTLATAGGLVFEGTAKGDFQAFRAGNGEKLWSFEAQNGIAAAPMTYTVDGEQYVAVMVGPGGSAGVTGGSPDAPHFMPNGRVMAFKLGGTAALPSYTPVPLPPANPSAESFTPEQVNAGTALYGQYCGFCHGGYILPDLRRSQALTNKDAWQAIVIDGLFEPGGMASFRDYLSADEAEDIRAYVAGLARDLQKDEAAAAVSH